MADRSRMTVKELRQLAKDAGVEGCNGMNKADLIAALDKPAARKKALAPGKSAAADAKKATRAATAKTPAVAKTATARGRATPPAEALADAPPKEAGKLFEPESFEPASVWEVTRSKFNAGVVMPSIPDEHLGTLPVSYGEDRLTLVPRDPEWLFVEWEITAATFRKAAERLPGGRPVLRLYVETGIGPAHFRDHDVSLEGGRFYARAPSDDVAVVAELGLRGETEAFVPMVRSAPARVPAARVRVGEPQFMTLPLDFELPALKIRGRVAGARFVNAEGRVLTEAEYRGLFGIPEPGSMPR